MGGVRNRRVKEKNSLGHEQKYLGSKPAAVTRKGELKEKWGGKWKKGGRR